MAMAAAESCAILFGRRGGSGGGGGAGSSLCLLPAARPQRHLAICCRARRKSSSSQLKKQRIKRVSRGDPISIAKHFSNNDGTANFQSVPPENITLPPQVATIDESSDASICVQTVPKSSNGTPLPLQMESVSVGKNNYVDLAPTIHLEDLVGMIKDVEKNVLLLNEARIHAVKELDKISAEKDLLEKEVSMLQMKLEQNTAPNINAVRENNPSRLFGDSSKLPNEVCSIVSEELRPYLYGNGNGVLGTNDHLADKSMPSISEGLISLRKENTLLKDEVQTLKMKLSGAKEMNEHVIYLEKERVHLETSVRDLESRLAYYQEDVPEVSSLKSNCKSLSEKVENLQMLLDSATKQADQAADAFSKNSELQIRINMLEASLEEAEANRSTLNKTKQDNKLLQDKVKNLEIHLQKSEQELSSHIVLYQAAVKEFQETLEQLKDEIKKKTDNVSAEDMPYEFWSGLLLMVDGWLLERKISASDAKLLREMLWKRDPQIRDAYSSCKGNTDDVVLATLIKLISSPTSPGLHIIHIAAELAPVSKVGGLGDVVSGISKALQRRGHLLEIILPKYDCMNHEHINGMKMLDAVITSYFDGQLYKSRVWVGTVEGLPVYFIEPQHPANLFARRKFYGEHDDFKRFSFFSRAALELLYQSGKRADIIHCHDWHTAFVAPLYWDIYVSRGFDSARIFFTCHNFEYQGVAPASDLASCGLNVHDMNRPDRLQDNSSRDRINLVKGAIIFSNIVTTVSPTYAQEVCTPEGGKGLHETLQTHSRKFVGILNGIDCEAWNPSTDAFLKFKYSADDMQGKVENKSAIRKMLHLDSDVTSKPLVCCITRLVPQKGVHLIRHAIYRTVELGGQFVLLGSSPVPHIQREFEDISRQFERHRDIRLILKYDDALSHFLYAASDMIIIPSMFEPCGLTQMIAMRYGSVPIARNTGGLHDSVFDLDDDSFPMQVRNGFTFLSPDEHGFNNALGRAFRLFMTNPDGWRKLVYRNMQADYSWGASSVQYEELYQKAVTRARAISHKS